VDELAVQCVPENAPIKAAIVKAEWFWVSVQNEGRADEKDYLFEDVSHFVHYAGNTPMACQKTSTGYPWSLEV
jgi:hypothetical protein